MHAKLAIADDHKLFRTGLVSILSEETDFQFVIEAADGQELIQKMAHQTVDVVLMDINMPVMDGIEATAYIRKNFPDVHVIAISMLDDEQSVMKMIKLGVKAYLLKNSDIEEVEMAIEEVMNHRLYCTDLMTKAMLKVIAGTEAESDNVAEFSERELEVAQQICEEKTTVEIGENLFISPRTVENHRKNMMKKIGARNVAGLVIYLISNSLVTI